MTGQRYQVTLESEVYGVEEFGYDTITEARKGFEQVREAAKACFREDGIDREVKLRGPGVSQGFEVFGDDDEELQK